MKRLFFFLLVLLCAAGVAAKPRIRKTADVVCSGAAAPDAACAAAGERIVRWEIYESANWAALAAGLERYQAASAVVTGGAVSNRLIRNSLRERLEDYLDTQGEAEPLDATPMVTPHSHNASAACNGTDKVSGFDANGVPVCAPDQSGSGGLPAGGVVLIVSGTCSSTLGGGWAEETTLSGKFLLGTVAANADISGTGGQDNITEVLNHTHPVNVSETPHAHGLQRFPTTTGTSSGFTADTSMSGTPAAVTQTTQSASTGITATSSNPAGGVSSIDNRPAFVKVIFCRKT